MTEKEFDAVDNHTNEERRKFTGLDCKWCKLHITICPSCLWRYTKLMMINKLLDGNDNWDDFRNTKEKRKVMKIKNVGV